MSGLTFILAFFGTYKQGLLGPREPVTPQYPRVGGRGQKILRTGTAVPQKPLYVCAAFSVAMPNLKLCHLEIELV